MLSRIRRGVLAGAAALILGAGAFVAAPRPTVQAGAETTRVIELSNIERAKVGVGPLAYNPQLTQAAEWYSQILASTGCWSHYCPPVTDPVQRVETAGYVDWIAVGENLAAGSRSPEETVAAWMNSPTHRAALLNPDYTEVGVAVAYGGNYGIYWAQEFGSRQPPALQPLDQNWGWEDWNGDYWGWDY